MDNRIQVQINVKFGHNTMQDFKLEFEGQKVYVNWFLRRGEIFRRENVMKSVAYWIIVQCPYIQRLIYNGSLNVIIDGLEYDLSPFKVSEDVENIIRLLKSDHKDCIKLGAELAVNLGYYNNLLHNYAIRMSKFNTRKHKLREYELLKEKTYLKETFRLIKLVENYSSK